MSPVRPSHSNTFSVLCADGILHVDAFHKQFKHLFPCLFGTCVHIRRKTNRFKTTVYMDSVFVMVCLVQVDSYIASVLVITVVTR